MCPDAVNPWSLKDGFVRVPRHDFTPNSGYYWRFELLGDAGNYNRNLAYEYKIHDEDQNRKWKKLGGVVQTIDDL